MRWDDVKINNEVTLNGALNIKESNVFALIVARIKDVCETKHRDKGSSNSIREPVFIIATTLLLEKANESVGFVKDSIAKNSLADHEKSAWAEIEALAQGYFNRAEAEWDKENGNILKPTG